MQGAVVERVEDATGGSDASARRVSIGGIDVLNVQTDLSWRPLDERLEPGSTAE